MKLHVTKRAKKTKSELSQIRYEKNIPAVLYGQGTENVFLAVNGTQFETFMRTIQKGHLPTTIFELEGEGKPVKAILKDIQYKPTTYEILHLDFLRMADDVKITVNVPIEYVGVAECVGIKLGGFLREVKRHLKIKCLPKDLPKQFTLDVRDMSMGQSKRVRDLDIAKTITPLATPEDVLVVIAKR